MIILYKYFPEAISDKLQEYEATLLEEHLTGHIYKVNVGYCTTITGTMSMLCNDGYCSTPIEAMEYARSTIMRRIERAETVLRTVSEAIANERSKLPHWPKNTVEK